MEKMQNGEPRPEFDYIRSFSVWINEKRRRNTQIGKGPEIQGYEEEKALEWQQRRVFGGFFGGNWLEIAETVKKLEIYQKTIKV